MSDEYLPAIIQGGLGAGVSGWRLARAVSEAGQLGVVSGTALDVILARRLQLGDAGGHVRRALEHFPIQGIARRILERYFVPGGIGEHEPFRLTPFSALPPSRRSEELTLAGNFVEVFLAKQGHQQPVGINYLEKIQPPTLPALYGAMLAGVSWVLMGAGIPRAIPGILDRFADGQPAELRLNVIGAERGKNYSMGFDPRDFLGEKTGPLARPKFIAIVSSSTLANMLVKKSTGRVDGFIVEEHTAGGHNAPPRGKLQLADDGQPVYGDRDLPDLAAIQALGLPFWSAGSYAEPERIAEALGAGASGIQVGTAFAYCEESDLVPELKQQVLAASRAGEAEVMTDALASPTGFPFKVLKLAGTLSEDSLYQARSRICDLAYLRHPFAKTNGALGWRCPAEPVADYVRKGGEEKDTRRRKCICNALLANIGLGQLQHDGEREKPLITSGDDVANVARFLKADARSYAALEAIEHLLGHINQPERAASTGGRSCLARKDPA